ncbi:TonB-dependent siderophore receptor [Acinetobacter bereziniae]|uniref:TonB-dependent receptor n=1 Tax=Acinetobacter TaxID=469 RepID=UPI000EF680A3|nr:MULTISPECIES: TonB-dependent siderophore receptor [Acinetobacter]MEC8124542.1 TonB-dependent siderophore receptor [Pseudomonadota bacterium]MBJ8421757.1 TonB-dependent siderophore receptor [Acinetobacter bereziniae]MBJ9950076.1 TonB-dependent siderophore receptor [Acinetobacter bereziniae]MCU4474996.1 TonB-dependent siderophore receptor [Acinetobacter bereziniae]MCU4542877.1 TonB-dependent siderophore receptor [Acinetobacter bereziniae]
MRFVKKSLTLMMLSTGCLFVSTQAFSDSDTVKQEQKTNTATLPTIVIEAMADGDPIKTYVDYKQASVTRNGLDKKDIPQTVDTIDVSKYKLYGANDLSVMLQGTPGVSTSYDTRNDGITIRGFNADENDIYRDGIRESGQYRRSTANVERIEILKGPASVLYGRSSGGGVINMVTKVANFDSKSSIGAYVGSYDNVGGVIDFNKVLNDNWAVRLVGEKSDTNSFRSGIGFNQEMLSPSLTYRSDDEKLLWTTEYTYDSLNRTPDRGPVYNELPSGVSIKTGFAGTNDNIVDETKSFRTDLKYEFAPNWKFHWALSHRESFQDFDNFFSGTWCSAAGLQNDGKKCDWQGKIRQNYAWQQTTNKTLLNTFDITGQFKTGVLDHKVMFGSDWSNEKREPILGNYSSGGSAGLYYRYVNPFDTSDSYLSDGWSKLNGSRPAETSHTKTDASSLSFFLQDLISFNEKYKIMLGVRYDSYDFATNDVRNQRKRSYRDESLSPNIGFVWQPVESQSFYTSYSKSFSPYGGRGLLLVSTTVSPSTYDAEPQYNEQYEIGVKSDWLDGRLNTQLSVFDITKNNIRYQPDSVNRPNDWEVGQKQQSQGVEFSFIGRVLDNLYVRGGYGYTDAKWKSDSRTGVKDEDVLKGKKLKKISENTGNLFVRYLPTEKWYGEVGATYVGSYYTTDKNLIKMPDWTRVDAAVGYKDDKWGATFAVNNLTDKEYWRSDSMPGTPRNYLFRVNYYF